MKKYILLFTIIVCAFEKSFAQTYDDFDAHSHVEFTFNMAVPHGEFAHNTHTVGIGAAASIYFPFTSRIPLYFGIQGGGVLFGTHSENISQQVNIHAGNTIITTLPIHMEVKTENTMWNGFASLRYEIPVRFIRPYIEAKIGFNYLKTRSTIYDRTYYGWLTYNDDDIISTKKLSGDIALSYGGEVGFLIPFGETAALKVGAAYLVGGTAKYFDETQINSWKVNYTSSNTYNPNNLNPNDFSIDQNAEPRKSATNTLMINIGFSFLLGG